MKSTTAYYSISDLVEILQEHMTKSKHVYEINHNFVRYHIKKLKIVANKLTGTNRYYYNESDLALLKKVVEEIVLLLDCGYAVVEEMFILAGHNTPALKGLIYYLAEKYFFGEKKKLLIGEHWVFDISETELFLKTYEKKPSPGRPVALNLDEEIEVDIQKFD